MQTWKRGLGGALLIVAGAGCASASGDLSPRETEFRMEDGVVYDAAVHNRSSCPVRVVQIGRDPGRRGAGEKVLGYVAVGERAVFPVHGRRGQEVVAWATGGCESASPVPVHLSERASPGSGS